MARKIYCPYSGKYSLHKPHSISISNPTESIVNGDSELCVSVLYPTTAPYMSHRNPKQSIFLGERTNNMRNNPQQTNRIPDSVACRSSEEFVYKEFLITSTKIIKDMIAHVALSNVELLLLIWVSLSVALWLNLLGII